MSETANHNDSGGYPLRVGWTVRFNAAQLGKPSKQIEGNVVKLRDGGVIDVEARDGSVHTINAKDAQ